MAWQERHRSVSPHFALTVFTINSFNMLSMTNWRRVCGRCGKKKIFLEDSNNTVPAVCRHLFDLTLLPTFKIFINNIILIFLSTGTDNISK